MGDREDKLSKAREKLEKFRKKKQKLLDPSKPAEDVQSNASSASSPVMFQMVNNPDTKSPTPVSQIHVEQPTIAATSIAASPPAASPPAASPPAASPPAASLSSYFGGPDTAVGETGFEVILPSSVEGSGVNQDSTEVGNSGSVSTLAEEVKDPNDFQAVSSIQDVPNIIEEALPEGQSKQSMQEENHETNKQPSVTTFFSTPNPVLEQITSYITSTNPVLEQTATYIASPNPVLEPNTSYIASPNPVIEQTATYIASPNPVLEETTSYITSPVPNPALDLTTTSSYFASPNPVLDQSSATFFTSPNPVLEEPSSLPYFSSTEAVAEVPEATANLTQTTTSFLPNPASEDPVPPNPEEQVEFIEQNFPSEPNYQPVTDNQVELLSQVLDKAEVVTTEESETFTPSSHTESLKQLSSHLSGLLADQSNFSSSGMESQSNHSSKVMELEQRNQELVALLDAARIEKQSSDDELVLVKTQMHELQVTVKKDNDDVENKLSDENTKLKTDLAAQTQTIELLVAEKTEVEASNTQLKEQSESLLQQKVSLEASVEQLGSACSELRAQVLSDGTNSDMLETLKLQTEEEIKGLKESLLEKEESYRELQSKLSKVSTENSAAQNQLGQVTSELEMCKVHLIQLRGSGAQNLLNEKDAEIGALNNELSLTRKNLGEAMGRVEHLAGEREQLAEQYRSYSRDLASQAERLTEQLRKFQDENARLLHREAGLVQNVASLESQLQKFCKEGKNVTEEEICRLKDQVLTCETELRMTRDEKDKLQQMLNERSNQVDEMGQRLAMRDNKIMELQAKSSGLETTVEMLKSTSHTSDTDQAQLLAACQSDKVAASMAMQQNVSLKARLEELQGALVTLTNSKAELLDQLETANRTISSCSNVQAEISARDEAVKERDIMLTNMRNQVRYLEEEVSRRKTPDREEGRNVDPVKVEENAELINIEKELYQARDMIRNLNSQNSELRSKLEVLSSNTRDCSESRCNSSSDGRDMVESSLSDSSDSFVELDSEKKSSVPSSDSFVNVDPVHKDFKVDEYVSNETDVTSVEQTVIRTVDLPFIPTQELTSSMTNSSVDNFESVKQLENRFMAAMEQLAELSSDKEQLEHLVERLQEETETIGDYVIMYQHQRKMQKMKIQEKEEQVVQLAKDRAELLTKLTQLQDLVTKMVDDPIEKVVNVTNETLAESVDTKEASPEKVSDKMASSMEKEKILELINEIGTGSNQMMARCENFEPWFWENSPSKVMTV